MRRTSVSRRLGMRLAGALRLTAIVAHLAAPLGLLLALASAASAVTPEQRYTLLQWDNEGGPKRTHPNAFVLAKKLGGAGDLSAVDTLLNEKRGTLASVLLTAYFGRSDEMPVVSAEFEALMLAYRSHPAISRMLLDAWRQRPAAKYASPALLELLLADLQDKDKTTGLPYLAAHVILSTDIPNAEERVLQALERLSLPPPESMVPGAGKPPFPVQSPVGVQGWSLIILRFAERKYMAALPDMKAWQVDRPEGDRLAAAIDRSFVIYQRPEATAALRDRMTYLLASGSAGAKMEIDVIGRTFAEFDRNVPTAFEQVRDLVPSALLEGSEPLWRELRRRASPAHVLILKVISHYRGLQTYADSGTIASSALDSGQFETRFARNGRYMKAWSGKNGARQYNWGYPGCNNAMIAFGGTISTNDCELGDKLPVSDLQSPALSVLGEGLDWFYKTDHVYAVENLEGDAKGRVRLKGTRQDHPEEFRTFVIDPATGAIDSAETLAAGGLHYSYVLAGKDNTSIPFWEFVPWGGVLAQFAPWRFTPRGMIGAFVYPLLLGLLSPWLSIRATKRASDVQRRRKAGSRLAAAMGLLGLAVLGYFLVSVIPLPLGPFLLLLNMAAAAILIMIAAVGFCFGLFCLEVARRQIPQSAGV